MSHNKQTKSLHKQFRFYTPTQQIWLYVHVPLCVSACGWNRVCIESVLSNFSRISRLRFRFVTRTTQDRKVFRHSFSLNSENWVIIFLVPNFDFVMWPCDGNINVDSWLWFCYSYFKCAMVMPSIAFRNISSLFFQNCKFVILTKFWNFHDTISVWDSKTIDYLCYIFAPIVPI